MSKFRNLQNTLTGGQISPTALGNVENPLYKHACKILKNMLPMVSGGAYRRPGTYYEYGNPLTTGAPRLVPFIVSDNEAYCLAIYPNTATGNAFVEALRVTGNLTSGAGVSTVQSVSTGAVLPYVQAKVNNGYLYDELSEIQFIQSAMTMWIVHPNHAPYRINRTALDTFVTEQVGAEAQEYRPYLEQNTGGITIYSAAATGSNIVITASAPLFFSTDVGGYIKITFGATTGYGVIVSYISSTQVRVNIGSTFGASFGTASATWWQGAWSPRFGYPRTVTIFEDRLAFGGNKYRPDSIWWSQKLNYLNLSSAAITDPRTTPTGTAPFTTELGTLRLNQIQWMTPTTNLVVGTLGEEWVIGRSDPSVGLEITNLKKTLQSSYGSSYNKPERAALDFFFCRASGDDIRSFNFSYTDQSFIADPVQLFFDQFPKVEKVNAVGTANRKIRAYEWDSSRDTLWCCDTYGNLFSLTRDRKIGVNAWAEHELGGFDSTTIGGYYQDAGSYTTDPMMYSPDGTVFSIAVTPNPYIGVNDVWLSVKRKINGTWKYYVERMVGKNVPYESAYDAQYGNYSSYVDSALIGAQAVLIDGNVVSALDHLDGRTIVGTAIPSAGGLGLFKVHGTAAAGAGDINFSSLPTTLHTYVYAIGLGFTSIVQPVRIEAGSQVGTAQGAIKRIHEASIRFYRTICAKIGSASDNLETVVFREGSTPMGKSAELFTGDKILKLNSDYDRDGYVYIEQDQPLPFCVVAIVAEGMTSDG